MSSTRLLDAALAVLARDGLRGLTVEEVAVTAGVSRQTVYRHVGSRERLVAAVVVREEEAMLATMRDAARGAPDLHAAIARGVEAALVAADEHPLLQRLLADEPDVLLPLLTLGSGPVLSAIGPVVAELVRAHRPAADPARLEFVADVVGRVGVSLAVNPRGDRRDTATRLADLVVAATQQVPPGK